MKTKKVEKKLTLNKKTVACLDKKEANKIKGGIVLDTCKFSLCACPD